jgi:hypothetical protein
MDRNNTDCEPRTVRYSTTDSPHVKKMKTNFAEAVLFSTEKQLLQYHGQSGLGGRTVRKYGHRAAKKAQKKSQLPDCPLQYRGLSANRETSRNRELRKSPPLFDLSICSQIFINCHETWWAWPQGSRGATSKRSSPNLKPINGKSKENEKHRFLRPRPRNRPIYLLVRNWWISFGGKILLTS